MEVSTDRKRISYILEGVKENFMTMEVVKPQMAGPTLTVDIKKHTKCFYSVFVFAVTYLFQATRLLVVCSEVMQQVVYKFMQSVMMSSP